MDISGNMREYVKDNFDCLKVLTQENRERLEENMYYRTFPKGQILFNDGDLRDRIFVLCSGLIRIEKMIKPILSFIRISSVKVNCFR